MVKIKTVKDHYFGHGTRITPLTRGAITPLFAGGSLGGGTSREALGRAKKKARLRTNHNGKQQ